MRILAQRNPRDFIQNFIKIVDFDGISSPMIFNWSQNQVQNEIEQQRADNKPVRIVVLKSRQVGISSGVAADNYTQAFTQDNFYGLVMAHEREVTESLFRTKYKFYHENLPADLQIPLQRSNKQELLFGPTNSVLQVVTAKSNLTVRSRTLRYLHGSECAFYDDFKTLKGGVEPSVPRRPGTTIIWESTAHGVGDYFHELYEAAKTGDNGYKAMFLEWFKDPQCSLVLWNSQKEMDAYMEFVYHKRPDLKERAQHYGLTPDQVAFYFDNLMNRYGGDDQWCAQEYPMDDQEAFLVTGEPCFKSTLAAEYAMLVREGDRYDPTRKFSTFDNLHAAQHLLPNRDAYLEVWEKPDPKRYYLICVDPSAGHQKSDFQAAYVIDLFTLNMVAALHGRVDPKTFALDMLVPLGRMYGAAQPEALLVCERDGIGEVLISHLKGKYFNLYMHRKEEGFGTKYTNKIGFEVNPTSRLELVVNARRIFNDKRGDKDFIPDKMLLGEMRTFIRDSNGKYAAQMGHYDDRVMAWMIGLTAALQELAQNPTLISIYEKLILKKQEEIMQKRISSTELNEELHGKKEFTWDDLDGPFYTDSQELL